MAGEKKYQGVVVPMATPVTEAGAIDEAGVAKTIEHVVANRCAPFVLGTTGEAASVAGAEKRRFVQRTVEQVAGRTLTYAGIGGNCLRESVDLAQAFFAAGADVVVAHLPCYYPIDSDHMLRYYERLADRVPGPLMVYNIPLTTHLSIPIDVVDRLSHHPNVVGYKESERGEERFEEALSRWRDRDDFAHFTGWAVFSAQALRLGSDGLVPSTGNYVPGLYRDLYDAAIAGDHAGAMTIQERIDRFSKFYQRGNVLSWTLAALKFVMHELGLCSDSVLPPLLPLDEAEKARIRAEMQELPVPGFDHGTAQA